MMPTWLVLLIVGALGAVVIFLFNRLVRARQMAREAWSGIDVQLRRRADLVPNLVEVVKQYATHERDVLTDVTQLRAAAGALPDDAVGRRGPAESALSRSLGRLMAVVEAYPDLKANRNFLDLQQQLSVLENELQMARRYYNGAVRNLNILVESFPGNLLARPLGFAPMEYFELDDAAARSAPVVAL